MLLGTDERTETMSDQNLLSFPFFPLDTQGRNDASACYIFTDKKVNSWFISATLNLGVTLPQRNMWQRLETCLVVTKQGSVHLKGRCQGC